MEGVVIVYVGDGGGDFEGAMRVPKVCCSVLQCVAVRYSALQCVAVYCSAMQCVAVRCSLVQSI